MMSTYDPTEIPAGQASSHDNMNIIDDRDEEECELQSSVRVPLSTFGIRNAFSFPPPSKTELLHRLPIREKRKRDDEAPPNKILKYVSECETQKNLELVEGELMNARKQMVSWYMLYRHVELRESVGTTFSEKGELKKHITHKHNEIEELNARAQASSSTMRIFELSCSAGSRTKSRTCRGAAENIGRIYTDAAAANGDEDR